jgi:hypothetical protein
MTNTRKPKRQPRSRKTACAQKYPPASPDATPRPAAVSPPQNPQPASATARKCPTHKRVRIGDALRRSGVDEWAVADGYVDVLGKLTRKSNDNDGVQKLFVDVLKEVSRHLEPPRAEAAPDAPVIVKLVHNVSRPARTPTPSS